MKIAILGNGSWGTALGQILVDNDKENNHVILFGIDKRTTEEINTYHTNTRYFPKEIKLPKELISTDNLAEALKDVNIIIFAIPTSAMEEVATEVNKFLLSNKEKIKDKLYIINVSKGFSLKDNKRMSQVLRDQLDNSLIYPIVSLIGPSHAEEVIKRMLTLITSTSLDLQTAKYVQQLFSNSYFRVYTNNDEIGAEIAAASKNAIAIAAGGLVGLGYGDNAKAALITRGLTEITRLGLKMGGKIETFFGLSGLGDLTVTCNSELSRNFMAGYEIGKTNDPVTFMKNNTKTVEGIRTCKVLHNMCKTLNIEMPIVEGVYKILYENVKPSVVIYNLMNRKLKKENVK